MPAPPPKGLSSTLRCLSEEKSRRSWMEIRTRPLARAFPTRLSLKGPANIRGKRVKISIFSINFFEARRQPDDDFFLRDGDLQHDGLQGRNQDLFISPGDDKNVVGSGGQDVLQFSDPLTAFRMNHGTRDIGDFPG